MMTLDLQRMEHSLASLADARAVMHIAQRYLAAWPDLHHLARQKASDLLFKHTQQRPNPDKVWWHRFSTASTSPRTFTGWQHSGQPVQSLTLTELVVRRFEEGFQLAPDTLDSYSGFYDQGRGAPLYNERNEVKLLPSALIDDFWHEDFATSVHTQSEQFWQQHSEDFILLSRLHLLANVTRSFEQGLLTETDRDHLLGYIGLRPGQPVTLSALQAPLPASTLAVTRYTLSPHTPLFTLQAADGRLILFTPTATPALRGFSDTENLSRAVGAQLSSSGGEAWFNELFRADATRTPESQQAALAKLQAHLGTPDAPRWPFGEGTALDTHLLNDLLTQARADLRASHHDLVNNEELRKAVWRGYLGAFLHVFAGFALAAWPLSLIVAGAGIARLGLDIDAANHARSAAAFKNALIGAVADSVAVAFSLIDVGLGVRALRFQAPPHETSASLEQWQPEQWTPGFLGDIEMQPLPAPAAPLGTEGRLQGVHVTDNGVAWIELAGMPYRVRYSAELHTWLVVRPTAPFGLAPLRPVRLNENQRWEWLVAPRVVGKDGTEQDSLTQAFWDAYLQGDAHANQAMYTTALQRQTALYDKQGLPTLANDASASADEHGYLYAPAGATRQYTYRQHGFYHNDLVQIYTNPGHFPNHLFRFGRSQDFEAADGDLYSYMNTLLDTLAPLPRNNKVALWRGGSAARNTSGEYLRHGNVAVGDILVSTDITSFTENPYALKVFIAPRALGSDGAFTSEFDAGSVVYELPAGGYTSGTPISPLSLIESEAETVFVPGRCFVLEAIKPIESATYGFVLARLREVPKPATGRFFDLRTGEPFDRAAFAAKVKNDALTERLFPIAQWGEQGL